MRPRRPPQTELQSDSEKQHRQLAQAASMPTDYPQIREPAVPASPEKIGRQDSSTGKKLRIRATKIPVI
jgi:hypothetical protein